MPFDTVPDRVILENRKDSEKMSRNQCNMTCQCVSGVKRHTFKNGVFYIPLFVIFFLRNFRYPRAPALSHFSTKLHESFQTLSFFLFLFHYIISLHPQWNQAMFTLYWVQTSPISFVALRRGGSRGRVQGVRPPPLR